MESVGFEISAFCFDTGDVTPTLKILNDLTAIFITYTMSHLLNNFSCTIGQKVV